MNKCGYSLLEVLIIIFFLSVILNLVLFRTEILKRIILHFEIEQIKKDINFAKNNAISKNKSFIFQIDIENNSYLILTNRNGVMVKDYENSLDDNIIKIRGTNFPNLNNILIKSTGVPDQGGTIFLEDYKGKVISIPITPVVIGGQIYE